ncbi:hypothetical protein ACLHZ0_20240 [Aeromonas salmonicida]|uniref:hypothetical protein n=1 Tax=Aeromonas salmonicida TaxID=645 RepID=UPI003D02DCEC
MIDYEILKQTAGVILLAVFITMPKALIKYSVYYVPFFAMGYFLGPGMGIVVSMLMIFILLAVCFTYSCLKDEKTMKYLETYKLPENYSCNVKQIKSYQHGRFIYFHKLSILDETGKVQLELTGEKIKLDMLKKKMQ